MKYIGFEDNKHGRVINRQIRILALKTQIQISKIKRRAVAIYFAKYMLGKLTC